MIDHVLGRPSVRFRKIQVLAVVSFWSLYLLGGHRHGPPLIRTLSRRLSSRLTAWQSLIVTLLWLYVARNFGKLVGLECPEPLANLYTRSFFRATWITTALDAGFWTAMRIRRRWLRDLASVVFSIYYLFAAEQADEKVRKVRGTLTIDHLRVSWNKATTPYLSGLGRLLRPKFTRYPPRAIRIPRPRQSSYTDPVHAWLYFDGPIAALKDQRNVVLDIPGGGFVAMDPRCSDDKLFAWAGKTGCPVLSLDYRKAPEYPYPYALNECYDVYHSLVASRGRCIGMSGEYAPKVIVTGDSAGGNLATGMVLMVLQSGSTDSRRWQGEAALPPPAAVILIYPALDMNIGNWMTEEQMSLMKDRRMRKTNRMILRRKSEDYNNLTPGTPHHSDDEDEKDGNKASMNMNTTTTKSTYSKTSPHSTAGKINLATKSIFEQTSTSIASGKPQPLKTRLAMSSMISYFNDRILTPEMMRAMIILYVGPHHRPDFSTDYLLSPLLAPESLLVDFPPVYFQTGERDPLVDDTVIFAGRIRQAKFAKWIERKEMGLINSRNGFMGSGGIGNGGGNAGAGFDEQSHIEVALIPGISHGFLQFAGVFPEAWKCIYRCARWMNEVFELDGEGYSSRSYHQHQPEGGHQETSQRRKTDEVASLDDGGGKDGGDEIHEMNTVGNDHHKRHHRRVRTGESSGGDDDRPLEMRMMSMSKSKQKQKHTGVMNQGNQTGQSSIMDPSAIANGDEVENHQRNRRRMRESILDEEEEESADEEDEDDDDENKNEDEEEDKGEDSKGEQQKTTSKKNKKAEKDKDRKRKNKNKNKNASTVSLVASEDDLLGRRMKGFTSGLIARE
ncbi:MAG: tryptophan synthetase [Watsoniomyces obsoletus]|nr:MAG: tryptophan synthetase [Watsoniomyces obsoletus]